MQLYLLRHGTTDWNAHHRIQGRSDISLDAAGEAIARATGEALAARGIRFSGVYTSPLLRARRTAELVACGTPIREEELLREVSFGLFEGRTVPEMMADPACAFRYFKSDPLRYNKEVLALREAGEEDAPESLSALRLRAGLFLKEVLIPRILREPEGGPLLISGHGTVNKALLLAMQKKEDLRSFWGKGLQANCGIHIIEAAAGPDGSVRWQVDENCLTFYDPALLAGVTALL